MQFWRSQYLKYVMQQIKQNLYVFTPQDGVGQNDILTGSIKIYLTGTVNLAAQTAWQDKFVTGLSKILETDPRLKGKVISILDPRMPLQNPQASLDNQEFVAKTQWELQMMPQSDLIFCNILKKSKAPSALYGLLMNAQSQGKLIIRCPTEYMMYPLVKMISDAYQVPLLGDSGTTKQVMELAIQGCPKFQENTEFGLEEK